MYEIFWVTDQSKRSFWKLDLREDPAVDVGANEGSDLVVDADVDVDVDVAADVNESVDVAALSK